MAYGKIKADAVIWDNSGTDVEESMSNIAGKLNASGGAMTGNLTLNAQNELRLADSDSSNYIALKAPATVGSNATLTLPANDGNTDQYLQTNGSGVLTWADVTQSTGNNGLVSTVADLNGIGLQTFGSIPSDVMQVTVTYRNVRWSSTADVFIRVGNATDGIITSGYNGSAIYAGTSGSGAQYSQYIVTNYGWTGANSYTFDSVCNLYRMTDDHWYFSAHGHTDNNPDYHFFAAGTVDCVNTLDRVALGVSAGSFTQGTADVSYYTES